MIVVFPLYTPDSSSLPPFPSESSLCHSLENFVFQNTATNYNKVKYNYIKEKPSYQR